MFSRRVRRPFSREAFAELVTRLRGLLDVIDDDLEVPKVAAELGPLAELDWLLSRYFGAVLVLLPDRAA